MIGNIKREQNRRKKIMDSYKMGVRVYTRRIGIDLANSNTRSSTSRSITKEGILNTERK
jgi:hypothetical protein